jgi:hypothetical protein
MTPRRRRGERMAKFKITFIGGTRDDEEVTAEEYTDHPPFVDFSAYISGNKVTVARYRAEEIRRVIRED